MGYSKMKESIKSYKELVVWQKAMDLVVAVYEITDHYPASEIYGLTSQIKRAAVSIPSNIAEGRRRSSKKDFCHFLVMAFGSGSELETQIEIVKRLPFGKKLNFNKIDALLDEVMRILNKMTATLQANS